MAKRLINSLQQVLPLMALLVKSEENLVLRYDKETDMLYVSFGQPQKANDTEIIDDYLLLRKKSSKIIGATIINYIKSLTYTCACI